MRMLVILTAVSLLLACKTVTPVASVSDTATPSPDKAYVLFSVQTQTDAAGSLESDAEAGFSLTLHKLEKS